MRKYNAMQKIWAVVLTLVMVIGMLPNIAMPAVAAGEQASLSVVDKVADPSSFDNWEDYYGDNSLLPDGTRGTSTWKAGGVWTDKSVYANSTGFPSGVTMDNQQNNFLVALSALASNKEIVGQSSAPSDTMLVLDLSQSMDNSGSVDDMVEAANDTIHALLEMNVNNRVGVVLYSGNTSQGQTAKKSSATVILPLDRYTTSTTDREWENGQWVTKYEYLSVTGNNDTTVSVADGTRNSSNTKPGGSKNTNGGTYIQNGLFQAWEAFKAKTDKGVVQSGTQAGVQRTPIVILMSDGAPTIATTDYYEVDESNTGNGSNTTDRITFLTQLTAAWTKGKISAHYNDTDALFYTVGLGTANNQYATAVLSPGTASNNTLRDYWTNYNRGSTDGSNVTISGFGNDAWSLVYQSVAEEIGRNYVNQYWSASNADAMINAFKEIVEDIGLQSAYSATLVESGDADLDGYITVQDELGAMMEVKDVKGILLGSTLYSGAEFAKSMNEGDLGGDAEHATDYGNEFIRTVKERLNIETSAAQQLVNAAYMDGQLSYTNDSNYSNYLGWYGDANNGYLGFWDKESGMTAEGAPSNAKYINKSYLYLGDADHGGAPSDMMHIIVMVRTEIATGHQTVQFKISSALIPMVEYKVELEGDSLETATEVTLNVTETDPIRLVYEVGLPNDVNNVNLEQKVQEYLAKDGSNHIHKDANGNYVFYANSWGAVNEVAPNISGMSDAEKLALTDSVAESHFIPNTANERFYVQEDSVVYTKNGNEYTPVTSGIDPNGTYYFARIIVTTANGATRAVTQYEQLQPATVANSANFQQNAAGQWEVKAGTIRQQLSNVVLPKDVNSTETIANTDQLWVNVTGNDPSDFNIYSFLGNNGKLTVAPATGIKVTKNVTEVAEGAAADEAFAIVVELDANVAAPVVTDADGNLLTDYTAEVKLGKTYVTVNLANGESAYITGVPAGTDYTVTEAANENYTYTYTGATETVESTIVEGVVTNEPVKDGNLYITKEVVPYKDGEPFPTDYEFAFEVTFVDKNGNPIANTEFKLENNYDTQLTALTTDANGVMRGMLRHGETVYIKDIPAGATVTVKEVNLPQDGKYTLKSYRSRNASGLDADNDGVVTIVPDANATVVVTNTYTPKSTSVDLDINGTKNFVVEGNPDAQPAGSFTFVVEQWNGQTWVEVSGKTANLDYAAGEGGSTKTFTIKNVLEGIDYSQAGTYTYQVREVIGDVANVTYDRTLYTFTVTVTDNNGQLEAKVTDLNNAEITDGSYEVTFNNSLFNAPVSIDIIKDVVDTSKNPLTSKAGFQFVAYEAVVDGEGNWTRVDDTVDLSVNSGAYGNARMTATYKEPGSYYFLVSEVTPDPKPTNWTYSDKEYKVEVKVTKDETTGDLSATLIIDGVDQQDDNASITFTNTYDPKDGEVNLNVVPTVVKDLQGRALVAGEFTFAIFKDGKAAFDNNGNLTNINDAVATGTNDAQGNVTFTPEKMTFAEVGKYEYDVVEVKGNKGGVTYDATIYDLVIEVTDAGDGTLKAVYYFEDSVSKQVTFQNKYTVASTEVVIDGLKTLKVNSGAKALNAGDYTFGLYNEAGEKIAETSNLANGTFKFDAIEYDGDDIDKEYTYTVKEILPEGLQPNADGKYVLNGVTYSVQSFEVTVKVLDNGDGTLKTKVTGNGANTIEFVNEYTSIPASVSLPGKKNLEGRDLTANEFKFALYTADANFEDLELVEGDITHDEEGNITFNLGTLGMGYHYFVIKEVIPEEADRAAGIGYDANEYHITVQVTDVGTGKMDKIVTVVHTGDPNTVNPAIAFNNVYRPEDGQIVIDGSKTYEGGKDLEAEDFEFGLYAVINGAESTDALQTVKNAENGAFAFNAITYTADDIGQTYTYVVREIIPEGATDNGDGTKTVANADGSKVIYSATAVTVEVSVADDNKDGVLEITKTVNNTVDGPISFTNTFVPAPITHPLQAKKTYEKGLKGGDFEFTLVSTDGKTNVNQTVENNAEGKVDFAPIEFTAAGEYKFKVTEKKDGILSFIRPSEAEYEVTVTVVNENGVLRVSNVASVNTKNTNESNLEFVNTYVLDGEDEVTISGTKKLTGDRTTVNNKEFQFGLYDANGKLVESVWNDENGDFQFSTLSFDETDVPVNGFKEITYTVKEIAGDNTRYTYDDTIYTVVITVKDNDDGDVKASYKITGGENDGKLEFKNTYTNPTPVTYTPTAMKKYDKTLTGGEFEFTLKSADDKTDVNQKKSNDATGKVLFDEISFPEAGVYTFTITEKKDGLLSFILPSEAEYKLTVNVTDNKGTLKLVTATVEKIKGADNENDLTFINKYVMDGEGEVTLRGTKTLTGDRTTVKAEEFVFGLYDAEGKLVESVKNDANGNFAFSTLTFDEEDTEINGQKQYKYTVKEIAGEDPYVTYDASVYDVIVTVKDDDEGGVDVSYTLSKGGQAVEAIAFANTFTSPDPVTVVIDVTKTVENKTQPGITAEDFEILLYEGDVQRGTVKTGATGKAGFQITYGLEDVGKTVTYKVMEKKGKVAGVTYDETVYAVKVTVAAKEDGTLYTIINDKEASSVAVSFKNIYEKPATPVTGDNFPVFLVGGLLLLSAAAIAVLLMTKKKTGKYAR